uniref:AIG1-type G domain-containing protein n=1 Tax=Acrobeloides nanus TaxID=290746 RepID=A0A914E5V6_9BILA
MAYRTVDEALTGPEICPIPCRLKIVDENYQTKDIQVGGYSNHEVMTIGQSSTQITVPYVTTWLDGNGVQYLVRLVDTPGIGDVRGPDFDKKHIANIVDHMAFVQEIHGICILLQPNNARLNLIFQYCLNELLSHLHRDSSKNIAFVFTNARGSNYKPGNTMHILRQFLSDIEGKQGVSIPTTKENMFFLDNEAFPYLCKARRKVEFDENEKEVYKQSWDFSRTENDRLFTFITSRPPHNIADTVTLNEARRLILSLAKPLADISSNIQTNIKVIENHMKLVIDCGKKVQNLTSQKDATSSNTQFTFTIIKLEASPLG